MDIRPSTRSRRRRVIGTAAAVGTVLGTVLGGRATLLPGSSAAVAAARPTVTTTSPGAATGPTAGSRTTTTTPAPQADPTATAARADCPDAAPAAIHTAPGAGRTVALTFDDGPGPDTEALLAVLREHHVHATFFMVGREAAARPGLVAAVAADGHLIGDHSWDHRYPKQVRGGWSRSWLGAGMTRSNDAIEDAGGGVVCWFRPPGGFMPETLLPAARAQGMSVVLWSVDPLDWKVQEPGSGLSRARRTNVIVQRVTAGIGQPHPLVLMHDGGGGDRSAGVAAVGTIIDRYRANGYRFVRLDGRP